MRVVCARHGTKQSFSCPYVPRSHGLIERAQENVQRCLSFFLKQYSDDWETPLQTVAATINSMPSATTGYSPNLLIFGRELPRPLDVAIKPPPMVRASIKRQLQELINNHECARKVAASNSEARRLNYKRTADKHARHRSFEVSDKVFVYIPRNHPGFATQMSQMWHGPFLVVEKISDMMYKVRNCENGQSLPVPIHVQRLKLAVTRQNWRAPRGHIRDEVRSVAAIPTEAIPKDSLPVEPVVGSAIPVTTDCRDDEIGENEYCIEKIIHMKYIDGQKRYLVKWKGFAKDQNSYVSLEDMNESARNYANSQPLKVIGRPKQV